MAKRRMISTDILCCEEYLSLQDKDKLLYIYLLAHADDDGFLKNYSYLMRIVGADNKSLENLINLDFVIKFDNGIIVITHWLCQNQVQPSKKTPTIYQEELSLLEVDQTSKYIFRPVADQLPTQYSIEENSTEELNINKYNSIKKREEKVSKGKHNKSQITDEDFISAFRQ